MVRGLMTDDNAQNRPHRHVRSKHHLMRASRRHIHDRLFRSMHSTRLMNQEENTPPAEEVVLHNMAKFEAHALRTKR